MIKSRYIFLGLAMILMLAGCGANRKTIRFGAAGIGGMYDSFANAYVSLANKEDFSYKLETRNTAGSAANVRLLSGKYIELGIAQADLVEEAYHGTGEFRDKAYQGYKAVAALYPEACQIVVRTIQRLRHWMIFSEKQSVSGQRNPGQRGTLTRFCRHRALAVIW